MRESTLGKRLTFTVTITKLMYRKVIYYLRRELILGRSHTFVITATRHLSMNVFI